MAIGQRIEVGGPVSIGPDILLMSAIPATLYSVTGLNVSGADRFLQVLQDAAPVSGVTVPVYSFLVLDRQTFTFAPPASLPGDVGKILGAVSLGWSTTQAVYTAALGASGPIYAWGRERV